MNETTGGKVLGRYLPDSGGAASGIPPFPPEMQQAALTGYAYMNRLNKINKTLKQDAKPDNKKPTRK